jgi:hypothetical protein
LLQSRNQKIAAGVVAAVILIGGVAAALALTGGDDEPVATTTTTSTTTTTTVPPTTAPPVLAPLTGLPTTNPELATRVALVVKVDNVEPKARPQIGINQADVVYEERVEGSVTRLLAIFHSTPSAPVGPVRSARTSDIAIVSPLRKPYFAWSGANSIFAERVRAANVIDVGYDARPGQYYRDRNRHAPDNLFLKGTFDIWALPHPGSGVPPALFPYRKGGEPLAHLEKVPGVRITFGSSGGSAPVEYRWNGKGWARTQKGTPHVDATGIQVAPENVIVQFVDYKPTDVKDQFGVPIPEAQTVGAGDAWVLTSGGLVAAHWSKPNLDAITTYTDVDGTPIALTPGRTWIALPPKGGGSRL